MPIPLRAAPTIPLVFDVEKMNVAPSACSTIQSAVTIDLSACDMLLAHRRVCTAYAFNGRVDPGALRARLSRALDTFVVMTGTPDRDANQLVIHPGSTVPFTVAESGDAIDRVLNMEAPGTALPPQYEPLGGPWCGPLLSVKLTHCDGGSVLALAMSHLVADGETLWAIAEMLSNDALDDTVWPAPRTPIMDERRGGAVLGMAKQWIAAYPTPPAPAIANLKPLSPTVSDEGFESGSGSEDSSVDASAPHSGAPLKNQEQSTEPRAPPLNITVSVREPSHSSYKVGRRCRRRILASAYNRVCSQLQRHKLTHAHA